jgi:hypothetical protein
MFQQRFIFRWLSRIFNRPCRHSTRSYEALSSCVDMNTEHVVELNNKLIVLECRIEEIQGIIDSFCLKKKV